MENRKVCNYCGNIYDEKLERCPLCGSSSRTVRPERTEDGKPAHPRGAFETQKKSAERAVSRPAASAKKAPAEDPNASSKRFLVASVIFLALAVVIVGYFIGDMIGWWPGLEDWIDRSPATTSENVGSCTLLDVSPDGGELSFTEAGQGMELKVTVNLDCTEEIRVNVTNEALLLMTAKDDNAAEGVEVKTRSYTLTALASGETLLTVTCGEKVKTIRVKCEFSGTYTPPTEPSTEPPTESVTDPTQEPTQPTTPPTEPSGIIPADYTPELNLTDVTLTSEGETFRAQVKNLPDGAEVVWTSRNEKVATVDESGKVRAVSEGTTTIVATVGEHSATLIVRCSFKPKTTDVEETYELNYTDMTIPVGYRQPIRLYDSKGNRITEGLSYRIGNTSVARLDENVIVGVAPGTTTVYVTYKGVEYKCIVRVTRS